MANCSHKHTGSHSPGGVYMYVVCMDCRQILAESELGMQKRESCPGWEREPHGHFCIHCHHDADYHIKVLTAKLRQLQEQRSDQS